jgi:hypothetical protein
MNGLLLKLPTHRPYGALYMLLTQNGASTPAPASSSQVHRQVLELRMDAQLTESAVLSENLYYPDKWANQT